MLRYKTRKKNTRFTYTNLASWQLNRRISRISNKSLQALLQTAEIGTQMLATESDAILQARCMENKKAYLIDLSSETCSSVWHK